MTKREEVMKVLRKHVKLALSYADDGAFATCSKLLHESAKIAKAEWSRRQRVLSGKGNL